MSKDKVFDAENELDWADDSEVAADELAGEPDELSFPSEEDDGFIADEQAEAAEAIEASDFSAEGTELEAYASAEIEEVEQVDGDRLISIVESLLFATDRPQSVAMLKNAFKGTNVRSHHIRRALDQLQIDYAGGRRGVYLEEVGGGFQLRTKADNMDYLRRTVKSKPFRVSGPALEVLSIVAYKQPCTKSSIDEIRGVESGHLLRALMEKSLVHFDGKSELPGKPMLYGTTRRFLEIFGLRNLNELPSLSEIDELIPAGIGEIEDKETLDDISSTMANEAGTSYSEGEDELLKISEDLEKVTTTTEFFEAEKRRMKEQRDRERAQDIREALTVGEEVADTDRKWLDRYDRELAAKNGVAPVGVADEPAAESASAIAAEQVADSEAGSVAGSILESAAEILGSAGAESAVSGAGAKAGKSKRAKSKATALGASSDSASSEGAVANQSVEVAAGIEEVPAVASVEASSTGVASVEASSTGVASVADIAALARAAFERDGLL